MKINYLDVGCTFRKYDLEGIVLSEDVIVVMKESIVEVVSVRFLLIIEEVVLGWHVVALAPVSLPLAEDWESGLDIESHMLFFSKCV